MGFLETQFKRGRLQAYTCTNLYEPTCTRPAFESAGLQIDRIITDVSRSTKTSAPIKRIFRFYESHKNQAWCLINWDTIILLTIWVSSYGSIMDGPGRLGVVNLSCDTYVRQQGSHLLLVPVQASSTVRSPCSFCLLRLLLRAGTLGGSDGRWNGLRAKHWLMSHEVIISREKKNDYWHDARFFYFVTEEGKRIYFLWFSSANIEYFLRKLMYQHDTQILPSATSPVWQYPNSELWKEKP